jgi:Fe-S-cluster containining protein
VELETLWDELFVPKHGLEEDPFLGGRWLRKRSDGACVFLAGKVGESVYCTLYHPDSRPEICAKFLPGVEMCQEARRVMGLDLLNIPCPDLPDKRRGYVPATNLGLPSEKDQKSEIISTEFRVESM